MLKTPLVLALNNLLSTFDFDFSLRRYTMDAFPHAHQLALKVGWCKL